MTIKTPCTYDPSLWFSDQPHEQLAAIQACGGCPIQEACRELGRRETSGVWGGVLKGRRHNKVVQPDTRKCQLPGCGEEFAARNVTAKFCSDQCRIYAARNRAQKRRGGPRTLLCAWAACGVEFTPRSASARFCSTECRAAAKKARVGGGERLRVLVAEWEPLRVAS
jgi:hypothetical protein